MLGVVRDGNYNPIQGQTIQLCGTGGVTESARGTDSGHVEWTQSWAMWKTVACAEAEIGGILSGDIDGCSVPLEDTEAHVCSVGVWTGGDVRFHTFVRHPNVGPTFYTSLLDGGGVVGLGVHRVAEASGGVGTW